MLKAVNREVTVERCDRANDQLLRKRRLQIKLQPVLIAPTERIHPHPPRPDHRLQAPRKQDPRRGMFRL